VHRQRTFVDGGLQPGVDLVVVRLAIVGRKGCSLRHVMGTFIGMSESRKGITSGAKQLPTGHATQEIPEEPYDPQ
jgi:hypothetical protein